MKICAKDGKKSNRNTYIRVNLLSFIVAGQKIFLLEICIFGLKYFHCSQIAVIHVYVNVSIRLFNYATMTQTESNQEVTKMTDNHAAEYYKNYVLGCK